MGTLQWALVDLLRDYTSNRLEVIVPHAVLRPLQSSMRHLGDLIARQQDAQEVLSFLLDSCTTGLEPSLPDAVSQDGVLLCGLPEEARVSGRAAPVDILGILLTTFTGDYALSNAPPLLIVRLDNIYTEKATNIVWMRVQSGREDAST